MANNVVTIGGRELNLTRPRGRAGRLLVVHVQETLRVITPAIQALADQADGKISQNEMMDIFLGVTNRLFEDPALKFEDQILPAMFVNSDAGLSDKEINKILDEMTDTPVQILMQYVGAVNFWMGMDELDQEEISEAEKK